LPNILNRQFFEKIGRRNAKRNETTGVTLSTKPKPALSYAPENYSSFGYFKAHLETPCFALMLYMRSLLIFAFKIFIYLV